MAFVNMAKPKMVFLLYLKYTHLHQYGHPSSIPMQFDQFVLTHATLECATGMFKDLHVAYVEATHMYMLEPLETSGCEC